MTRNSQINVTPYIDILLVLLIIFMVVQQRPEYQLESRAPQSDSTLTSGDPQALVLSISSDFELAINRQPVRLEGLGGRLFEVLSSRAQPRLFISGTDEIPFGFVARIIDVARGAGAGEIGLLKATS